MGWRRRRGAKGRHSARGVAPFADMGHSWRRNAHRSGALRAFFKASRLRRSERKLKHWS